MNYCCDCIYYITDDREVDEYWNCSSNGFCDLGGDITGRDECFGKEEACNFFKEKRRD
jgi:hypothetical protein